MPSWQDIVNFISGEWRVIQGARATFTLSVVMAGLLLWGALSWRYSAQLDNKDSIIAARNATIQAQDAFLAEYRSKLKGASPDEVVKKIANLESEVQSLQALERARSGLALS
jgi:hypothetical protein